MNDAGPYPERPSRPRASSKWVVVGVILLVAVPVVFKGCAGELDRWRAAAVMERYLDGHRQEAIAELRAIVQRLPDDHRLKLVLGEWLLDDRRAEESLDLARAIPEEYRGPRAEQLIQHSLLALGRPDEALQAFRQANPAIEVGSYSRERELWHKNSLAYYQALAGADLATALRNSTEVVNEYAQAWNQVHQFQLSPHLQCLFCAGRVYRRQLDRLQDQPDRKSQVARKALSVISGAIEHLQTEYDGMAANDPEKARQVWSALFWDFLEKTDPSEEIRERREAYIKQRDELAHTLAVFLSLRALVYQDHGNDRRSFADRRRVQQLGFDPETIVDLMPGFTDCLLQANLLGMFLDTRGCVYYQLTKYRLAEGDLNAAVMAQEAVVDVADFAPRTTFEFSLDPRQQFEQFIRAPQRILAVYLFHRSWVRRATGQEEAAIRDLARIRKMGFVPDSYLF